MKSNRKVDAMQGKGALRLMTLIALGVGLASAQLACGVAEEIPPEQVNTAEQALCKNDTHCEFYTDSSYTTLCGERDTCINCSANSSQWGCVGSPHRQCWNMGSCGSSWCWVCNEVTCYWEVCNP